jgi:hypothetical protein
VRLAVQIPRELNLDTDLRSHPSRVAEVVATAQAAGLTVVEAPVLEALWTILRAVLASPEAPSPRGVVRHRD